MFFRGFEKILESIKIIEEDLKNDPDDKESIINNLLNLRNIMDQCVKYWLYFEEKVNELQKKYNFILPDVFPDHLLEDINLKSENTDFLPEISSDCNKSTVSGKQFFLKLESEQGIDSFRKGLGFWDLAMLEEAINEFEKVVKIEPNFIFGHFCLGLAYSQKGLYNQALSKLRLVKALNRDPHLNAFVYNAIGNIYANERQYEEALYEFSLSVEEDPSFYIGYFNMGAIYFNLRKYKKSAEIFEKVKAALPYDWEVCYCLGRAYMLIGKFVEALQNFKKALTLNPMEPKVLFEMGVLYDLLGDKKSASYCFDNIKK
ncbi:MAG: tetratricopeptide repeat protein [Firmicutes bacterium]|nr:tetratricopeptide repeat protein [Bacillota bacterium]